MNQNIIITKIKKLIEEAVDNRILNKGGKK
jgi:hypothetical protein